MLKTQLIGDVPKQFVGDFVFLPAADISFDSHEIDKRAPLERRRDIGNISVNWDQSTYHALTRMPAGACEIIEIGALKIDKDGNFEIILSKEPKGENWLKIEENTTILMVRQTYLDRVNERPIDVYIKNLDGRENPDPLTDDRRSGQNPG